MAVILKAHKEYRAMHALADSARPSVRRAFLSAIEKLRRSATLRQLEEALASRNVERAVNALDWDDFKRSLRGVTESLREELIAAARYHGKRVKVKRVQKAEIFLDFDLLNPLSASYIRQYEFDLITAISNETREAIRQIILDAFEEGGHPYVQAREIRALIGLTERGMNAVSNYWDTLLETGMSPQRAEELAMAYYGRLLTSRAETIARTETIRAAAMGREALWRQAMEQGLLNPSTTRRIWIVTPDDRLCAVCSAIPEMNPNGASLFGPFRTPDGPVTEEPVHPNCRCSIGLEFEEEPEVELIYDEEMGL